MTLPLILLLAILLPLGPLPACTEAFAYMDTERSFKLDAPFVRTPDYVIAEILSKAGVGKDDILYDLGSGDGRIVIEAAKKTGCRAVGIEIDSDLVDDSRSMPPGPASRTVSGSSWPTSSRRISAKPPW